MVFIIKFLQKIEKLFIQTFIQSLLLGLIFRKNKKKYFDFSKSISIEYLKKNLKRQEKRKVENFKKRYLKQSNKYIPWMTDTKYKTLDNFLKT